MNKDQHNMERLARELYLKHKKTLDFIMEHGARTDFDLAVQQLFGEDTKLFQPIGIGKAGGRSYVYTNLGKNFVGFLPTEWFQAFGSGDLRWPGCDKYWAEMPLTCWFGFAEDKDSGKGSLRLYAEVGPISDPQFRAAMIDSIRVAIGEANLSKASFRRDSTTAGKRYSRFLNNSTRKISNIQDADEIAADMAGLLREFQTVFDAVAQALPSLTTRAQEDGHAQRREVRGLS